MLIFLLLMMFPAEGKEKSTSTAPDVHIIHKSSDVSEGDSS